MAKKSPSESLAEKVFLYIHPNATLEFNKKQTNGEADFNAIIECKSGIVEVTTLADQNYLSHRSAHNKNSFIRRALSKHNYIINVQSGFKNWRKIDNFLSTLEDRVDIKCSESISFLVQDERLDGFHDKLLEGVEGVTRYRPRHSGNDCHMVSYPARGGKVLATDLISKISDCTSKKATKKFRSEKPEFSCLVIVVDDFADVQSKVALRQYATKIQLGNLHGFDEVLLVHAETHFAMRCIRLANEGKSSEILDLQDTP